MRWKFSGCGGNIHRPSKPFEVVTDTMQGQQIGPFFLQKMIGQGGQSAVWLSSDVRTGQPCALKVLRPGLAGATEVARLRREAALLGSLSDPGLPRGFQFLDDGRGSSALAMEFINGHSLSALAESGAVSPTHVLALSTELARIVSVLHSKGISHRDIKPANIMLREGWERGVRGSVVLVDLGIARGTQNHATAYTATGFTMGTFRYMPPEAILGVVRDDLATQGDVFALGVLMWILLTGQHPTGLPASAALPQLMSVYARGWSFAASPQQCSRIESVVPGLVGILERCLRVDASSRFTDGGQLLVALASLAPGGGHHLAPALSQRVSSPSLSMGRGTAGEAPIPRDRGNNMIVIVALISWFFVSIFVAILLASDLSKNTSQERDSGTPQTRIASAKTCSSSCERGQLCAQGRCMTLEDIQGTSFAPCRVDLPTDLPAYDAFAALRQAPSKASAELARLQDRTPLKIFSLDTSGWAQVSADGLPTGYIHRDILACDAWVGSPPPGGRPPGVLRMPGKK